MSANKLTTREALDVAETDAPGKCPTCTGLADEGQRYCMYWEQVENGLYDEPWSSGWADQDDEGEPAMTTGIACVFASCGGTDVRAIPAEQPGYRLHCSDCGAMGPVAATCDEALSRFRSAVARTEHERAVEALRFAKRLTDNINEFGQCTDAELYDAAWLAIEAALKNHGGAE